MQRIAILMVSAVLMMPAAALAQSSSTCQAYNPQLCNSVSSDTSNTSTTNSASTLPFTGLDVALLAAGGATLVGAGFVVRRLSRRLD
jgi:hypothetical protein